MLSIPKCSVTPLVLAGVTGAVAIYGGKHHALRIMASYIFARCMAETLALYAAAREVSYEDKADSHIVKKGYRTQLSGTIVMACVIGSLFALVGRCPGAGVKIDSKHVFLPMLLMEFAGSMAASRVYLDAKFEKKTDRESFQNRISCHLKFEKASILLFGFGFLIFRAVHSGAPTGADFLRRRFTPLLPTQ